MPAGQPKTGESWWKGLTECGPLEKGMANHFSILALNTMKRQNDRILKEVLPRSVGAQYATEGQEGHWEEIPLIQGKEQQLCFAGAAVKRYPTPKVRKTQVRW